MSTMFAPASRLGERLRHPRDGEVGVAVGEHLLRHDVDRALEDLDVEALLLVEALLDGRVVAGELRLRHPLQLQLDGLRRVALGCGGGGRCRSRAAAVAAVPPVSVVSTVAAVSPVVSVASAVGGRCRAGRRLRGRVRVAGLVVVAAARCGHERQGGQRDECSPGPPVHVLAPPPSAALAAAARAPTIAHHARSRARSPAPPGVATASRTMDAEVEGETEQARADHVRQAVRLLRRRHVRRDLAAEPVLRPAEVLGHEGGDHRDRRGDLAAR